MKLATIHRLMTAAACLLALLLLLRAVTTIDPYWDSFSYHLWFAARLAGLCPDSCYRPASFLQAIYGGFPKLFHRLQGLVWEAGGLAQAVDVLNLGAIALFCVFLRRWFTVPWAWTFCGLVAVPLIQIQATSSMVDLPVNLAMAAAIVSLMALARAPETFGWRRLAVPIACTVFAANSKPQMIGVAAAVGAAFSTTAIVLLGRGRRVGPFVPGRRASRAALACLIAVAGVLTAAKPIDNAVHHGNPFYPVRAEAFGIVLDGPFVLRPGSDSLADAWRPVPGPLRWLASVLELGAYSYREAPWTFDQGYCVTALTWKQCWRSNATSFHMGGYFVVYVLGLLAFLAWRLVGQPDRERRILVATLVGATVLVAVMPRSHELRYYMFWMMVLVSVCLIATFGDGWSASPRRDGEAGALLGTVVLIALVSVLSMTRARYVVPSGPDLATLIDTLGIEQRVAAIPDGAIACVDPGWQPFTFLFAPLFHPGRSYTVLDGRIGHCDVVVPAPAAD